MAEKSRPSWSEKSVLDVKGKVFAARREELASLMILIGRLTNAPLTDTAALSGLIAFIEHALALHRTLTTALTAAQTLSVRSGGIGAVSEELAGIGHRLMDAVALVLDAVKEGPCRGMSNHPAVAAWRRYAALTAHTRFSAEESRVTGPLAQLYSHLRAGLKVRLTGGGTGRMLSFANVQSVLKNTDDLRVRSRVFGAANAWFAENAVPFADLLNAVTGAAVNRMQACGMTALDFSLKREGLPLAAFDAMISAVREAAPVSRRALRAGCRVLQAAGFAGPSAAAFPVSALEAPYPLEGGSPALADFHSASESVMASYARFCPEAARFMDEELTGGWLEARSLSSADSGAWCRDLPAEGAVALFADYQPTDARGFELAHTFGEAWLRKCLQALPSGAREVSETVCEIAARLGSEALLAHLMKTAPSGAVYWLALRRTVVNLLWLPFRSDLTEAIYAARRTRFLSVSELKRLTREAWKKWFAESVDGTDEFIWAAKAHFYQPRLPHHDFQYVFGFLAAQPLLTRLTVAGETATGADYREFLTDCGRLPLTELFAKHLEADITDRTFWGAAVRSALKPAQRAADFFADAFGPDLSIKDQ